MKKISDRSVRQTFRRLSSLRSKLPEPKWFHPFPARMPISFVEALIERLSWRGATVLDPMAGSGTTLVAAARLRRIALGFDSDPLAVTMARSVTQQFDAVRLRKLSKRVGSKAARILHEQSGSALELPLRDQADTQFIDYWFPSQSQQQLAALATAIRTVARGPERDFAWTVFSSLIVAKSAGASFALDLAHTRPHRRPSKPISQPFRNWEIRFEAALRTLKAVNLESGQISRIEQGDARNLPLEANSVDLVLTSPPYHNAIDYLRAHKFSLVWMGQSLAKIRELRGQSIGSERGLWESDGIPDSLELKLQSKSLDRRKKAIARRFLSDLTRSLGESSRVLKPDGLAVYVLGTKVTQSKSLSMLEVIEAISKKVGLQLVASGVRTLDRKKRALPLLPFRSGNPLGLRMRSELVVALRKVVDD